MTAAELELARSTLSPAEFSQESEADCASVGGKVLLTGVVCATRSAASDLLVFDAPVATDVLCVLLHVGDWEVVQALRRLVPVAEKP